MVNEIYFIFKKNFKKMIDSSKNNNCALAFLIYAMVNMIVVLRAEWDKWSSIVGRFLYAT